MSFTEWYEKTYNDKWTDNHAPLHSLMIEYEDYCRDNNIEPIWNG
jgi:hypothetical protein